MPTHSMTLTKNWVQKNNACDEAYEMFCAQKETNVIKILRKLMRINRFDWASWLIVRKMTYRQYVSYAVYAAEQVIDLYEKEYPDDERPRNAIEAAKKCIKNPSKGNKSAAESAAWNAAWSARSAAWSANSAWSAAAEKKMQRKTLNYGIKILEKKIKV